MWWLLLACVAEDVPAVSQPSAFEAPDAFDPPAGRGGPAVSFDAASLYLPCAYITGDERDEEHHNLAVMHDGYLVHPWAPEEGAGGISFWNVDDPCAPELVGQGYDERMRETHTLAFGEARDGREYLAVDYLDPDVPEIGGVGFWDITDRTTPEWVGELATPGFRYPDSYLRVTFSSFWQGDVVYVSAAFNGLMVIDASDPHEPVLVNHVQFSPPHLLGSFTVVGNVAMAASAGTSRFVMMDVSDPWNPTVLPGGDLDTTDASGNPVLFYFSAWSGRYGLFARKDLGGGPIVYDLADPYAPVRLGDGYVPEGDGGYVYRQGDTLFQGDSVFAATWDFSDPARPVEGTRMVFPGDLDTVSPIGNVMLLSVDSGADPGQATSVIPWAVDPDATGPVAELHDPPDGATFVATTGRIGVSFDEWVERASVFSGSFRVADDDGEPVPGRFNVQENVVNFTPDELLLPDTTYRVSVPAGGITDISGNPTEHDLAWWFSTGDSL